MQINRTRNMTSRLTERTHEGACARKLGEQELLKRLTSCALLWENSFYVDGVTHASLVEACINKLVERGEVQFIYDLAKEVKSKLNIRHMPMYMVVCAINAIHKYKLDAKKYNTCWIVDQVIQRADELAEFVALYWQNEKKPLPAAMKKGIAHAFSKFNEYDFGKYNRKKEIKLRDVMFLCHPKPSKEREELYKKIANNTVAVPDTWEVGISAAKSNEERKEVWERLFSEKKLGALALLRNLRNMAKDKVSITKVKKALNEVNFSKVLPFRFIAAKNIIEQEKLYMSLFDTLEQAFLKRMHEYDHLDGSTVILVDVSGSMEASVSDKSDLTRMDAACGLAACIREICNDVRIFTFSNSCREVVDSRGFKLCHEIIASQMHSGTYLAQAVKHVQRVVDNIDRLIIITDEQSAEKIENFKNRSYLINVGHYENGIGYGKNSVHIHGFSEAIVTFMLDHEKRFSNEN